MPFKYASVRARLDANSKEYPKPEGEHYAQLEKPCRLWTGPFNSAGYGKFSQRTRRRGANGFGKVKGRLAHRVSLADHLGVRVWELNNVGHLCDRKPCIEPEHLHSTSQRKNIREAIERGRHRGNKPLSCDHCAHLRALLGADPATA